MTIQVTYTAKICDSFKVFRTFLPIKISESQSWLNLSSMGMNLTDPSKLSWNGFKIVMQMYECYCMGANESKMFLAIEGSKFSEIFRWPCQEDLGTFQTEYALLFSDNAKAIFETPFSSLSLMMMLTYRGQLSRL